jgi:hypothetical protein
VVEQRRGAADLGQARRLEHILLDPHRAAVHQLDRRRARERIRRERRARTHRQPRRRGQVRQRQQPRLGIVRQRGRRAAIERRALIAQQRGPALRVRVGRQARVPLPLGQIVAQGG